MINEQDVPPPPIAANRVSAAGLAAGTQAGRSVRSHRRRDDSASTSAATADRRVLCSAPDRRPGRHVDSQIRQLRHSGVSRSQGKVRVRLNRQVSNGSLRLDTADLIGTGCSNIVPHRFACFLCTACATAESIGHVTTTSPRIADLHGLQVLDQATKCSHGPQALGRVGRVGRTRQPGGITHVCQHTLTSLALSTSVDVRTDSSHSRLVAEHIDLAGSG
jgi:hypothetical protein